MPTPETGGEGPRTEQKIGANRPPVVAERVNVALITEAAQALEKLQQRTQLKKVDIVNRALSLYEFIDAEIRAGNELIVRAETGDSRIKIF